MCGPVHVVSPRLAASLLAQRPQLAAHACQSGTHTRFGECIEGALLAHALEHLAIDLLVERSLSAQPVTGATTWLERETATMQVRLGYATGSAQGVTHDTSCTHEALVGALKDALELMNVLLQQDLSAT
jgi:hypothetical protein